jgi:hypothetical protein
MDTILPHTGRGSRSLIALRNRPWFHSLTFRRGGWRWIAHGRQRKRQPDIPVPKPEICWVCTRSGYGHELGLQGGSVSMLMAVGRDRVGLGSAPISTGSARNRASMCAQQIYSGGVSSSGNDVTEAKSGPTEWTQIGSPENRMTQSSLCDRFDCRIDQASLAAMADLGMSDAQIARYRRLWWRCKSSALVRADAQKII